MKRAYNRRNEQLLYIKCYFRALGSFVSETETNKPTDDNQSEKAVMCD